MDKRTLLQDLHFQLSNAGSGHGSVPKSISIANTLQLEVEDRKALTEKWVTNVNLQNRQRSLSSDSYFRTYSVCDKLKKSFLKPYRVTEEDLEDLRERLAQVKLGDSGENDFDGANHINDCPYRVVEEDLEDLRVRLAQEKLRDGSENDFEDGTDRSVKTCNSNNVFVNQSCKPAHHRRRSRTVPLCNFSLLNVHDGHERKVFHKQLKCDAPRNLDSIQSVDLIKDIIFDENRNIIPHSFLCDSRQNEAKSSDSGENEGMRRVSFQDENLFPSSCELKKAQSLNISRNRVSGRYRNGEEYLRTQFYLLREDFIRPLKEGIADYKSQLSKGAIPDEVKHLKLYHNVHVIEPRFKENKLGIAIEIGFPLTERIGDKDFMTGSLVLLTPNHFEDMFVGSVISRNFISRGLHQQNKTFLRRNFKSNNSFVLMVQLHDASHFNPVLKQGKMLLAEAQAFFQPYFYVMKILQSMTERDLPMAECIIRSKKWAAVSPPSYLREDTEYILEENFKVKVRKSSTWPTGKALGVNDSQLKALKRALSQRLVVIQGPPGTGKTYLGCKVAKALLQNRSVWNREGNQPMLLMCQTNHALDQFMELLLPVSKKIIRIGNQSKSALLAPFNIREWLRRSNYRSSEHSEESKQEMELKALASNIKACRLELSRVSSHGVVDLETFSSIGIMEPLHAICFTNSQDFLLWLEEAKECQDHRSDISNGKCTKTASVSSCHKHGQTENFPQKATGENQSGDVKHRSSEVQRVHVKYIVSLPDLEMSLKEQRNKELVHEIDEAQESLDTVSEATAKERLQYFQRCIQRRTAESESDPLINSCLWSVPPCMRWAIYRSWIRKLESIMQSHLMFMESYYIKVSSTFADLKQHAKLTVLKQAELVGMTTSAAARLYPVLRELHCPIALVEEAAEVHEPHIVATITKHCQHLILLGDHKQLKPRPACYDLSKTHFTDLSLFERLLMNNTVTLNTLLTQHRMQPEISALIRPSIYPELYDHACTRGRKNVLGMRKNVFFFSHQWKETKNELTGSYSNIEEAKMAVQIVRYLLREECSENEICILTAYREQVSVIAEICKPYPELNEVRVLTVDNFQGEECRVVVLSLVRNNTENQIGFLKIENRVCVALSRARDGLYMLGNIELLSRNSGLWLSVYSTLQKCASVGWSLPLNCRRHPRKRKFVFNSEDLQYYMHMEGCHQLCSYKLACGHFCRRMCHADDELHLKYRCEETCRRTCACGHKCYKKCFEECGDECEALIWKSLYCGHTALTKCCLDMSNYLCGVTVSKNMEPCSHKVNVQCWMPSLSHKYCPNQCPALLKCGHKCPFRCNSLKHPNHNKIICGSCENFPREMFQNHELQSI